MDEPDMSNFSTSSSHRLPTISASQALQNAATPSKGIPSGLQRLDSAFRPATTTSNSKGLPRGQLTEVYGPPGVGKTAFAMQLASNALNGGDRVVWIDTGTPMPGPRFQDILQSYRIPVGQDPPSSPPITKSTEELLKNLTYFNLHTLPHLLVLFLHPTANFPPDKTVLIIVDNISAPFATAFPRSTDAKMNPIDFARKNKLQWAANRKWAVAGDLAAAMAKMAALKNVAILVINQVAISIKGGRKAVLKPAIGGTAWEAAIYNRVTLWRDFAPSGGELEERDTTTNSIRFAQVVKAGGKSKFLAPEVALPFIIEREGLREVKVAVSPSVETQLSVLETATATKRKVDEIADSEGEEGDEVASDEDFGLPDDEIFTAAMMDKS